MIGTLLTMVGSGFAVIKTLLSKIMGETIMAGRSGNTTINININTGDDVFDLLGKGLVPVNETYPESKQRIDVKLGGGLEFDSENGVSVKAGAGLSVDSYSSLNVNVGEGLAIEDNKIMVTAKYSDVIGDGLKVADDGMIVVDTGEGIEIVDGKVSAEKLQLGDGLAYDNQDRIIIDNTVPGPSEMFQAVSDIKLSFDQGVLTLTKIMTTYNVARSKVGTVVGVQPISNKLEYENVTLGNGGYGFGFMAAPIRPDEPGCPNLYKVNG